VLKILKKQGKLEGGLYPGELTTGYIFLFTGRWAYNRGSLEAGGLISSSLRYAIKP